MQYLLAFLLITGLAHGQGSIKDEFSLSPAKEIEDLRRTELSDPEIIKRLVLVDDNFSELWENSKKFGLSKGTNSWDLNSPLILRRYEQIYMDPTTTNYYLGLLRLPKPAETNGLGQVNWGKPKKKSDRSRLVFISNLSAAEKLMADAANGGILYIQHINYIPDFYKGYEIFAGYLYDDPENKTPLKMLPITNNATGAVAYKGFSPKSGRPFYALRRYGHYEDEIYPSSPAFPRWINYEEINPYALGVSGTLEGFSDTPKEVWEWRAHNNYRLFVE